MMYSIHTSTYLRKKVCTWYILGVKSMYQVHTGLCRFITVPYYSMVHTGTHRYDSELGTYNRSGFQMYQYHSILVHGGTYSSSGMAFKFPTSMNRHVLVQVASCNWRSASAAAARPTVGRKAHNEYLDLLMARPAGAAWRNSDRTTGPQLSGGPGAGRPAVPHWQCTGRDSESLGRSLGCHCTCPGSGPAASSLFEALKMCRY